MLVRLMCGGGRWIEVNPPVPVYKGRMEGEAALSRFLKEKSKGRVRWYWKEARACRPWKPRGLV
jgi:hypothetical protein